MRQEGALLRQRAPKRGVSALPGSLRDLLFRHPHGRAQVYDHRAQSPSLQRVFGLVIRSEDALPHHDEVRLLTQKVRDPHVDQYLEAPPEPSTAEQAVTSREEVRPMLPGVSTISSVSVGSIRVTASRRSATNGIASVACGASVSHRSG